MTFRPKRQPLAPEIRAQSTGLRVSGDFRFNRLSLPLSFGGEAGIVSLGLHLAFVVLAFALIGLHLAPPPPDETVVSIIPEAPPQGDVQPQAVPPEPQPATTARTNAESSPDAALPLPPPAAPPRPVPPRPRQQLQARTQGIHVAAQHRGTQAVAITRPAEPDASNVVPDYSLQARMAGEQGEVHFVVEVTPWGNVRNVTITGSSGHADLDDSVRMAVLQWHFRPATQGGKPMASTLKLWVRFEPQ